MCPPIAVVLLHLLKEEETARKACNPEEHITLKVSLKHE